MVSPSVRRQVVELGAFHDWPARGTAVSTGHEAKEHPMPDEQGQKKIVVETPVEERDNPDKH